MANSNPNMLNQQIDVAASETRRDDLLVSEEATGLGLAVSSGSGATFASLAGPLITISGLSGMTSDVEGKWLTFSGASNSANNSSFSISQFLSSSSVVINGTGAVFPEFNSLGWILRLPNSLEQDLNYIRSDRARIKGVSYDADIPTYTRPNDTGTQIPANLANLAGKGLDSRGFVVEKIYYNQTPTIGNSFFILTQPGNLNHSNNSDRIGIPCFDLSPYINNFEACYVEIVSADGNILSVLSGVHAGEKIFGLTSSSGSTSPNSVRINLFSFPNGGDLSTTATPYVWENGQSSINISLPRVLRADQIPDEGIRKYPLLQTVGGGGSSGSGITEAQHQTLRQLIHFIDGGPATGFASGAYREILPLGNPFPTSIIWYENISKLQKIVEKTITYNSSFFPTTINWKIYNEDGYFANELTDSIFYDGYSPFESYRTRSIT